MEEISLNRSLKVPEISVPDFVRVLGPGGICSPIRQDVRKFGSLAGINGLSPREQPSRFATEQISPGG
jgi:hypothetical protein